MIRMAVTKREELDTLLDAAGYRAFVASEPR
jgi:hypothetical protein